MSFKITVSLTDLQQFNVFFAAITDINIRKQLEENNSTPENVKQMINLVNDENFVTMSKMIANIVKQYSDTTEANSKLKESADIYVDYIKKHYPQALELMTLYANLSKSKSALTGSAQVNTNVDVNAEAVANAVAVTNVAGVTDVAVAVEVFVAVAAFVF
ncbi:hypothetical protein SAMN05216516_11528 [Izhakiella capsodis]|uniref:Uncharacterized protein n=1 Tax=Izhakiella capsodis TaxID=1367852 RepID=A0A1I5B931_9GAMM|nr:hypothetical protein [Izhakiella capsodis]SFN71222.1 hypothetical protein SAMN05216516_11528 [Izhakiella capsodis]